MTNCFLTSKIEYKVYMKKLLPFIIFFLGIAVVLGAIFVVKSRGVTNLVVDEEQGLADIPAEKRPIVSLTPSSDGHWLKLVVGNLVFDATTLDYELLYEVSDGRPSQGVGDSVKLEDIDKLERDLLLGTESSGKFRYDKGVKKGTLTLRFRNENGKTVGKLKTDFTLDESDDGVFSVTMNTFGESNETKTFSSS